MHDHLRQRFGCRDILTIVTASFTLFTLVLVCTAYEASVISISSYQLKMQIESNWYSYSGKGEPWQQSHKWRPQPPSLLSQAALASLQHLRTWRCWCSHAPNWHRCFFGRRGFKLWARELASRNPAAQLEPPSSHKSPGSGCLVNVNAESRQW